MGTRWAVLVCLIVGTLLIVGGCDDECNCPSPEPTAPTAAFTVTPSSGTVSTVFHLDASGCTDAEDSPADLQVRWNWDDDGTWDTGYSTTKTADHQFDTAGTKRIRLEVKDTGGLTDTETLSVVVTPAPPPPLLSEGFETPGNFADTWQVMDGAAAVVSGGFGVGSYWAHGHATGENDAAILLKDAASLDWSNYTFAYDIKISSNDAWCYAMSYFYVQSSEGWSYGPHNGYGLSMGAYQDTVWLYRITDGVTAAIGSAGYSIASDTKYRVRVVLLDSTIRIYIDNILVLQEQDETYSHGTVVLSAGTGGGGSTYVDSYYDNIDVTPTSTKWIH